MTKSELNMPDDPWPGLTWWAMGLFAFLFLGCWCPFSLRHFKLWLYGDRYVAAELEVTRFHPEPEIGQGDTIEGVIHPGGELVLANSSYIAIRKFVDPNDVTGRRVPLPDEIEGKRLDVWYWPQHSDVDNWWHPPTVVMPGGIPGVVVVVLELLTCVAFVAVVLFCFRRGYRLLANAFPPDRKRDLT